MWKCSRRDLLSIGALSVVPPTFARRTAYGSSSRADREDRSTVHVFSKHLQWLDYGDMAGTAADIGFDGIDLTVRPGGHVVPERVVEDLPKAVEAAKSAGIDVTMITTAITDPRDPLTKAILRTASDLGVRYYRMGYYRYDNSKTVPAMLDEIRPQLRDLAAMNERYRIAGTYQNHAGDGYVGAALWDLHGLLRGLDPRWIGCQYDIRHATVEGGMSWPTTFRLITPHVNTLVMKDFRWVEETQGWRVENCPLGDGMVDFPEYFSMLEHAKIRAPISLHLEYPLGGAEKGARQLTGKKESVLGAMRKDLRSLKAWLTQRSL